MRVITVSRKVLMFVLDPTLQRDSLPIGELPFCRLLLANDSNYPWFILVPRVEGISEVFQLEATQGRLLWDETVALARAVEAAFPVHKVNVATLGNVVSQLHMHVIARRQDDAAWPSPVWGRVPAIPYKGSEVRSMVDRLSRHLGECEFEALP